MRKWHNLVIILCALLFVESGTSVFSQSTFKQSKEMNRRGVDLGEQNRLDDAIREFDRAILLRDQEASKVYHNKGFALEKKGEIPEAIRHYEEAWKRNPKQIVTGERLGFLYYQTGDFERAVTTGEAVMKLDPNDKDVPLWLSEAYKKRAQKRQDDILAMEKKKQEEADKLKEAELQKKLEQKKEEEKREIVYVTIDSMLRTGSYFGSKSHYNGLYRTKQSGYHIVTDRGLLYDLPYSLNLKLRPLALLEIDILVEKPWLGALSPNLIEQSETLELLLHFKKAYIGAGALFNHYHSSIAFFRTYTLWDAKAGFILGFNVDKIDTRITWYPRMLILDGPHSPTSKHHSLDVGLLKIDFSYQILSYLKLYGLLHARDYYVFSHKFDPRAWLGALMMKGSPLADYWGVYDLGLGIGFTDIVEQEGIKFSFSVEWIERFYLRDIMKDNPYTLAPNGQGWFGANMDKWFKGKPFSGVRYLSQVIGVRFEEKFSKNFFMYQKLIAEIADQNADHHEFNFLFGLGVRY